MAPKTNSALPKPVVREITEMFNTIATLLQPYLKALTSAERMRVLKMSDKTLPFVEKTCDYTLSAPQFIPSFMDAERLLEDFEAFGQLSLLLRHAQQLAGSLDDSAMRAGTECYSNALCYYNSVKQATKMDVPGAKSIYNDLNPRFVHNSPAKDELNNSDTQ